MLVLSRRVGEEIVIADRVRVRVTGVRGNRVQLAIVAPRSIPVYREEIRERRHEFAREGVPIGQSLEELSERRTDRAPTDALVGGEQLRRRDRCAAGA